MSISWFFLLELTRCSVLCKGSYITNAVDPARVWVGYDNSFNFIKSLTTKLKYFHCELPGCLLEVVDFVCTFNGEYYDIPLNMTSNNENRGNISCLGNLISKRFMFYVKSIKSIDYKWLKISSLTDSGTSVVVSWSYLECGGIIGISSLVLVKRLMTNKQR